MAGEIGLFLIECVLNETPSTWQPGDPLYCQADYSVLNDQGLSLDHTYSRPMFELLPMDGDEDFEGVWGHRPWHSRDRSYSWCGKRCCIEPFATWYPDPLREYPSTATKEQLKSLRDPTKEVPAIYAQMMDKFYQVFGMGH